MKPPLSLLAILNIPYSLSPEDLAALGYVFFTLLPNGDIAGIAAMSFGKGRICSGINPGGFEDAWCYESIDDAVIGLLDWATGEEKEPNGWIRHPYTGRRRPSGDPTKQYVEF